MPQVVFAYPGHLTIQYGCLVPKFDFIFRRSRMDIMLRQLSWFAGLAAVASVSPSNCASSHCSTANMKAAVVQEDKTLKIVDKTTPALKANEILLKTKTIGLNPTGVSQFISLAARSLIMLLSASPTSDWKVNHDFCAF